MNRKNHGQSQSSRPGLQAQPQHRGGRGVMANQTYGHDVDQDYDSSQSQYGTRANKANFSGLNTSYGDDSYDTMGSQSSSRPQESYRDADYDLDGSTYGRTSQRSLNGRPSYSQPSYGASEYGDYEANDRSRQPSRASSLDEERYSSGRSMDRQASSSERFGYPSNMNSWSGSERSYNAGNSSRTAGRTGQGQWGAQGQQWGSQDSEMGMGSYTEGSFGHDQSSQKGFYGKGPKGYKRSDDRIKEEVCETLARNHRIDASDIEVTVEDACVTLSGTIDTREARRAAEMAIENLSGVDDVKNEIRVKKSDSMSASSSTSDSSSYGSSAGAKNTKSTTTNSKNSGHIS